jgi:hypothetical protein
MCVALQTYAVSFQGTMCMLALAAMVMILVLTPTARADDEDTGAETCVHETCHNHCLGSYNKCFQGDKRCGRLPEEEQLGCRSQCKKGNVKYGRCMVRCIEISS